MYNKTCIHDERGEIEHLCNIRHDKYNEHESCDPEKCCKFQKDDCPHIFAFQLCDCGQKYVGKLGEYYKDTTEYLEEKI